MLVTCTHIQVQFMACASLSSVSSVNQAFKAFLVGIETLEDGKTSICPAYGKSGHRQSRFAAEYSNFRFHEPSQKLSTSFQLAIEVALEDYSQ